MKLFNLMGGRLNNKTSVDAQKRGNNIHSSIVYQIHDYLKSNAVGYENRLKSYVIMQKFGITDNKTFRGYIEEIRQSPVLQKIICSEAGQHGGYWVATNEQEVQDTLDHLYNRAMEMLKTYSIIKNKLQADGQYRIKTSKYQTELIESILRSDSNGEN